MEDAQKISINELIRKSKTELKKKLVESQIEALGTNIQLCGTRTRFGGERLWFLCPQCGTRVGTLYSHAMKGAVACRQCVGLKYKKQRYKGMIETVTD